MSPGQAAAAAEELNTRLDAWRAGQAMEDIAPIIPNGTIARLIDGFYRWPHFRRCSPRTQQQYRAVCRQIDAVMGDMPIALLTRATAKKFVSRYPTPAMQRYALAAIRRLATFAVDEGHFDKHPFLTEQGNAIELGAPLEGRIRIWTAAEADWMIRAADALALPSVADAIVLGLYTGQRKGDVLAMRWPARGRNEIVVAQSKMRRYGRAVVIPIADTGLPAFEARLADMRQRTIDRLQRALTARTGADAAGVTPIDFEGQPMVATADGSTYASRWFATLFDRVRRLAALMHMIDSLGLLFGETRPRNDPAQRVDFADLTFPDLRDTCISILHDSGASIDDICTITGHTPGQTAVIVRHYLQLTGQRARRAMKRRGQFESGE
jgi:integrase